MSIVTRALAILLAGMAAGASFAHAASLMNAEAMALASLLDVQRVQTTARAALSWSLDLSAVLLAAWCTIRLVDRPPAQRAAGIGVICLLLAVLFALLVVQPDMSAMAEWAVSTAPANAIDSIAGLAWKHMLRGLLELVAGLALGISLSLDRPVRKRYAPLMPEDAPGFGQRPSIIVPGE